MSDLKQLIIALSTKKMDRKQFLTLAGGSFLGMIGFFHILQSLNTPDMIQNEGQAFGDKEYGRPGTEEVAKAKAKSFSADVFG